MNDSEAGSKWSKLKTLKPSLKMEKVMFWLREPIMLLLTEISLFGDDDLHMYFESSC